ncbi:Fructose-1,6-bisphosphatase, chloroplastic [Vitis vinifera]|uniref:Fructose-1,6-bisphosphatase, chloroplastic n=1 Tax=Vitis vinifera TaxID=29760 RepID=A0A438BY65_VITVI|nr:Fructose-1,6-bisphosphatase, chloroplastic [Vitis vinifera]
MGGTIPTGSSRILFSNSPSSVSCLSPHHLLSRFNNTTRGQYHTVTPVLIPRVPDDPRSCRMDGHAISTHKDDSRVITTLQAAVRNRGDGTWALAGCCDSVKIRMRVTRMTMRVMCHCKMRATCLSKGGVPTPWNPMHSGGIGGNLTRDKTRQLTIVLSSISLACKRIASLLQRSSISNLTGGQGTINVQGEDQKKVDVISNEGRKIFYPEFVSEFNN